MAGLVRTFVAALLLIGLAATPGFAAGPAGVTLAVLPLENASGEADQAFLGEALSDEIVTMLARVPNLHVVARASSTRLPGTERDPKTLGRLLTASHLVTGSARRTGDMIRLSVRLLRTADGAQLWTQDYYSKFADVFDIEEDVGENIAKTLQMKLGLAPGERLVRNRTADMSVYEQYLRARSLIRLRGQKPFADAAVLLEQAVARDPKFAPALALLAFDYDLAPLYHPALRSGAVAEARAFTASVIPKAEAMARRAAQLDPKLAVAFTAQAYAAMVQGKMLESDGLFLKALALDPENPDALHGYSQMIGAVGRVTDSIAIRRRMQVLEPYFVNYVADNAEIFWLGGEDDLAIAMLQQFRPNRTLELAQIVASQGKYREAANHLREMGQGNYLPGVLEAAARLLESAPAIAPAPESLPRLGNLGFVFLHVGAPQRDLEYYESNLGAGYFQPISSTWFWHSSYAPVRKLERFKTYARSIGFVEYWRAKGWPAQCRPQGADDFICS